MWSGSAVVDDEGRLVVFYTGHRWRNGVDDAEGNLQVQCMAVSTDGVTFEKKGPVIEGPPELQHFRDPKVWRQDGGWYMVFGASSAEGRGEVWLYTSTDLRTWQFDRVLYRDPDPNVFMVECPDLIPFGDRWVIAYGPMTQAKQHGYALRNGHNGGYVVGRWAPGGDFEVLTDYRPLDWGHHYYATQGFEAPDGRRLMIGWMGGFVLPLASQAEDGWSGQLAVPREVRLSDDNRLISIPIREVEALRTETADFGSFVLGVNEDRVLWDDAETADIELEVDLAATTAEQVGVQVHRTSESRCTYVAYDDLAGRVSLDRRTTGPGDRGYRSAPFGGGDRLRLRILVDRGSVEVFVGDGDESVSSLSFPADGPRGIALSSVSGTVAVTSLRVHRLKTIWDRPDR